MLLTEGQMSDHKGAFLLLSALPNAKPKLNSVGGTRRERELLSV